MCPVKEPNFFAAEGGRIGGLGPGARWIEGTSVVTESEYRALFDRVRDERVVGEVSPRYMVDANAAARIHATLPGAKIVAVLRQPVDRAFASFVSLRRDGIEPLDDFHAALEDEPRRISEGWASARYLTGGRYAEQLRPYFARWPSDRIRIYLQEELLERPRDVQRDLFSFLNVDETPIVDRIPTFNRSAEIANPVLASLWRRTHELRTGVRGIVPKVVRDGLFERLTRGGPKPRLDPSLRRELTERLRPEIEDLARLIDRDLSHWLENPRSS